MLIQKIADYLQRNKKKIITYGFYGLLVVFLLLYIDSLDLSTIESITISWPLLALTALVSLGSRYFTAYIWIRILKSLGAQNIQYSKELMFVYAKAWLGRYIPGKAPWILGKIYFASQHGVSKNKLAVSSLLEAGVQVAVNFAIAFFVLLIDPRTQVIDPWLRLVMAGVLLGCVITIIPSVFNKILAIIYRVIKKKKFDKSHYADSSTVFTGAKLYTLGAFVGGLSFFLVAKAVYPEIAWSDFLFVFGASKLANAVSMLAVFAPSGIGVREGIQVVLLSIIMPLEIALSIAIITRLWFIVVDLMFYFIAYSVKKLSIINMRDHRS